MLRLLAPVNLSIIALLLVFFSFAQSWEKVRDLRMPGELRVVNEGVAHDENNWYFSNQHFLYQTTVNPINITLSNHDAIPEELRKMGYNHIGDIDIMDGLIYSGLEGGSKAALAKWRTSDLTMVSYAVTEFGGLPWIAVQQETRRLYSAEWNDCCAFQMFDMDTFAHIGEYRMPENVTLPGEIQGGAFYNGFLYICTNARDEVWKVDLSTGALSLELSDSYNHHDYEMEGLDFWDLSDKGLGVMHLFGNFMQAREKSLRNYKP